MKLGIVSDIHGSVADTLHTIFADCDKILFAGDAESARSIMELEAIAPVVAVQGNCDRGILFEYPLPACLNQQFDGVRFYMTHRPEDIPAQLDPEVQVVVHGHTHIPRDEMIEGVRYLNPGSATRPMGGSAASCIVLEIKDGAIERLEFVPV